MDDAARPACRRSASAGPVRRFGAAAAAVIVVLSAMGTASCSSAEPPAAAAALGVVPEAVELPSLNVRAPVEPVDLGADRVLKPPDDPDVLGWWQAGRRPGSPQGSALFTGHTISTGGGALERLEELRVGDPVIVRSDGTAVQFEVVDVEVMSRAELTERAETLFDQDGAARVLLITCEDWDGTDWLSNVVVQAVTP
ncbi:MAG TPA: class F sortase [Jiangellaceae bacterium]